MRVAHSETVPGAGEVADEDAIDRGPTRGPTTFGSLHRFKRWDKLDVHSLNPKGEDAKAVAAPCISESDSTGKSGTRAPELRDSETGLGQADCKP